MRAAFDDWYAHGTMAASQYSVGTWLFLRALGVIYAIAFGSLGAQIIGLAGRQGILPVREFLSQQRPVLGAKRFFAIPTLCWFKDSDHFLRLLCWGGVALSALVVAGIATVPALALLFVFYLSLFSVMRLFLGYQWDILLLETGFLAIFIAPLRIAAAGSVDTPAWPTLLLLYWLLFRLMFLSGLVKLRSGDPTWRQLTALAHHYETQPLPTPPAWYAHQFPAWFHKISTLIMFVIEMAAPILIFAPPPWRHIAGLLFIALMLLIMITGNYCFFNLLTLALCLLLFDNDFYTEVFPWFASTATPDTVAFGWPPWPLIPLAIVLFTLSIARFLRLLRVEWNTVLKINRCLDCLPIVNHYGLFSIMTTVRMEIIVEGSNDGKEWRAYEFKWKPGDPARAPPWVAPHQPRLDWQMWFAALSDYRFNGWFIGLLIRLLQGSPPALALLRRNPFPESAPIYIRAVLYEYRFSDRKTRLATGAWWTREKRWLYCPVYSLKGAETRFGPG